jgi:hypothetical protein
VGVDDRGFPPSGLCLKPAFVSPALSAECAIAGRDYNQAFVSQSSQGTSHSPVAHIKLVAKLTDSREPLAVIPLPGFYTLA